MDKNIDIASLLNNFDTPVDTFLASISAVQDVAQPQSAITIANESIGDIPALNTNIKELLDSVDIQPEDVDTATEAIQQVMSLYNNNATTHQNVAISQFQNEVTQPGMDTSFMSLLSPRTLDALQIGPGMEAFGQNTNLLAIDLRNAIKITLLQFHLGFSGRMLPHRITNQPSVTYTQVRPAVISTDDPADTGTPFIQMYNNPTSLTDELKRIIPSETNDGTNDFVPSGLDGWILNNVAANLFALSVDANDPKYSSYNRTDLVADGVFIESLRFDITQDTTTETFVVTPLREQTRLSRVTDGAASARSLHRVLTFRLESTATVADGSASALLGAITAGEALIVNVDLSASIDLRTSKFSSSGFITFDTYVPNGGSASTELTALLAGAVNTKTFTAIKPDARFSEENFRKATIGAQVTRAQRQIAIPPGTTYYVNSALAQTEDADDLAVLAKLVQIGDDAKTLNVINDVMGRVQTALTSSDPNAMEELINIFISGHQVRPYIYSGTMDLSTITSMRDADRSGDIIQHAASFLAGVVSLLHANSYITQQLVAGAIPTYRVLTSNRVKDGCLSMQHIFQQLNVSKPGTNGVELSMLLPNQVKLEVLTTTYASMDTKMIVVPYFGANPNSPINFGHWWDYGNLSGTYTPALSGAGQFKRTYVVSRKMPIITTPVGAVIDVDGLPESAFMA